jgi:carbon storage regulator
MLVLTLKEGEKILIGDKITVMLVEIRGAQIRLGIEAPDDVLVLREKLAPKGKAWRRTGVDLGETPVARLGASLCHSLE